jgi:hypothetical protein
MENVKSGFFAGTGAAINISVGFIPSLVILYNATDGSPINQAQPNRKTMAFTSGGTNEIKAGHQLKGATSGATADVVQVITDTGTWAGGDAAGWFILDAESETGTFASESVYYDNSDGTNDGTGAATAVLGIDIDTEVATDAGVTAYKGSTSAARGFTCATAVSTDAKLFAYSAFSG